jgi:hypothetical protein
MNRHSSIRARSIEPPVNLERLLLEGKLKEFTVALQKADPAALAKEGEVSQCSQSPSEGLCVLNHFISITVLAELYPSSFGGWVRKSGYHANVVAEGDGR